MNARVAGIVILALCTTQLVSACALFEDKEGLPEGRRVKVVAFPVRSLEFGGVNCRQELDRMNLSGSLTNVSLSALSQVQVRTVIFYANQPSADVLILLVDPPLLQPNQAGTFSLNEKVHDAISRVELHVSAKPFMPSGP